ncbi:ABC transporter ATP-binding protein [Streptomyces adustus]|uniref:ABC transporter ATP-binding protein n=1 Tax=Streptomyces adustus TaxID=1609272 RepID=UPI0035E16873
MRGGRASRAAGRLDGCLGVGRRLVAASGHPRRVWGLLVALACVGAASSAVGPLLLSRATDAVVTGYHPPQAMAPDGFGSTPGVDLDHVAGLLSGALLVYGLAALSGVVQARLIVRTVQCVTHRLRSDMQHKLSRLPLSHVDACPRGDLLARTTVDIDNVGQALQQALGQSLASVVGVGSALAMMLWISPLLAAVALVSVPVSSGLAARVSRRAKVHFAEQWDAAGTLSAHVDEVYSGHAVVRAFGRQEEVATHFSRHNRALSTATRRARTTAGLVQPLMMLIGNLNYVLVVVVGGWRAASGTLTVGDVQAFVQYTRQCTQPFNQIAAMTAGLQSGIASAERVFAFLDADEEAPDPAHSGRLADARGHIALHDVSFSYDGHTPAVDGLSLAVPPGRTGAIVGPSGAGKTTLVSLLLRFLEPTRGRILFDGVDITEVSRTELRSRIGMVPQDTWLFHGTIAQNIAYGAPGEVSRDRIVRAATLACADRFIRALPDGYDTLLDEERTNLSAGERQLIAIARAFLADPAVLVLDEATSAVDTRTEVLIRHAMTELRAGRTCFVIAHRMSTIRDADVIFVLDEGRVVESGRHEDLFALGGHYARLCAAQTSSPTPA